MATQVAGVFSHLDKGDSKEYSIASSAYGYCETAAATAAKVVDMTGFELKKGVTIFVKFKERNNAANPTLNVNGTGAKPIYRYATTRPGTGDDTTGWRAGAILAFTYDGTGWVHHFWQNTQYNMANQSLGGGNFTAATAIYRYQLLFHTTREKLTPLNTSDNNTGTNKTMLTTVDFDPFERIYYYNSTMTVSANGAVSAASLHYAWNSMDLRYTFNSGSTLTAQKDLYLKCSKQSNGLFRIASASPLVQALPSSNDGYYYILLGRTTNTTNVALYEEKPIYYHDGTGVVQYTQITASTTSIGSASAGTAIPADDITAWSAGSVPTLTYDADEEGIIFTAGTAPSLSYTAKSIPNISVSSKTVVTGIKVAA